MARDSRRIGSAAAGFFCWSKFDPSLVSSSAYSADSGSVSHFDDRQQLEAQNFRLIVLAQLFVATGQGIKNHVCIGMGIIEPLNASRCLLVEEKGLIQFPGVPVRPSQVPQRGERERVVAS